jgi:predicted O-methyltransferase YrrM
MTAPSSSATSFSKILKALTLHPSLITYALTHPKKEVVRQHDRLEAMRLTPRAPFHNDTKLQQLILSSIRFFNVQTFLETGTFRGDSTIWLSEEMPDLNIVSVELEQFFYKHALKRVSRLQNQNRIRLINKDSSIAVKECFKTGILKEPTMFWLDAHWNEYWPLVDEITEIVRSARSSIILIDDFKVPFNPELEYDSYGGTENSIEYIGSFLGDSIARDRDLLYPNYSFQNSKSTTKLKQRGYVAIYLGLHGQFAEFTKHYPKLIGTFTRSND